MNDEDKEIVKMTLEEFKEYCNENDYNIVDKYDRERFPICCGKCNSKNIQITFRPEEGAMGSEYTGYMKGFVHDAALLLKCIDCGNAMVVSVPDY
jgi:hypothetical protein